MFEYLHLISTNKWFLYWAFFYSQISGVAEKLSVIRMQEKQPICD
ncbi:MAG: hypothetical protein ACJA0X_003092 [Cyclobacteriaceae bacterium]|jgi:hypothetical protein